MTGPATDNDVGVQIIEEQMNVRACNAISNGAKLGDLIIDALKLPAKPVGEQA